MERAKTNKAPSLSGRRFACFRSFEHVVFDLHYIRKCDSLSLAFQQKDAADFLGKCFLKPIRDPYRIMVVIHIFVFDVT